MFRSFILPFFLCLILAAISINIEHYTGSNLVVDFLTTNGLLLIAALFVLNVTTTPFIITRLLELEREYGKPYALDCAKKSIFIGLLEQIAMFVLFYILMIISPTWKIQFSTDKCFTSLITDNYAGILGRAALFFVVYSSYDYAKGMVKSTMQPSSISK